MNTQSLWKDTKTFFSTFSSHLEMDCNCPGSICIFGASDGKFVIPLAEKGWNISAIDIDKDSLYGGKIESPNGIVIPIPGILSRLKERNLEDYVKVYNENFMAWEIDRKYHAIFTSCSWHYSLNHDVPLINIIEKMQSVLGKNGIFCAEYMMPCEEWHYSVEHYVKKNQLKTYFPHNQWEILECFYTDVFEESAHVGNVKDHKHRMGFFIAKKLKI